MNKQKELSYYLIKLFTLSHEYNAEDFHVFCDFSGHVNTIWLRVFPNGWQEDKAAEVDMCIRINDCHVINNLKGAITTLTKLNQHHHKCDKAA